MCVVCVCVCVTRGKNMLKCIPPPASQSIQAGGKEAPLPPILGVGAACGAVEVAVQAGDGQTQLSSRVGDSAL